MKKHIIALVAGLLSVWGIIFMLSLDSEVDKMGMIEKIIAKSKQEVKLNNTKVVAKKEESEEEKKLKVLKEKAGNLSAFDVSPLYKRKCSSCHGVNGQGIIGPKLIGKSEKEIYNSLIDFKTGKRKNYVMFGLLNNMKDEDLKALSKEIGSFEAKLKAAN